MTELEIEKQKLCKKCVNLLEHVIGIVECDFDKFEKIQKNKIDTYTPIIFDCEHFEDITKL